MWLSYRNPLCPSCSKGLRYVDSFKLINPWKCRCPYCRTLLEMSKAWKAVYVASPFVGFAIAGVAIYQEEMGRWGTSDSLLFLLVVFALLMPVGYAAWPFMRLHVKREAT